MNRSLNTAVTKTNLLHARNLLLKNYGEEILKRNYSCLTEQHRKRQHNVVGAALRSVRLSSTETATAAVSSAPIDIGFLASFYQSVSSSTPVAYMQQGLVEIHDFSGLPWWASIIATTFLFRTIVTLPLAIYQHKIAARLEKISLEMPPIIEELKKEAAMAMRKFKWTEAQTKVVYQRSVSTHC